MTSTTTPTLTATSHCGAVRGDVPHPPPRVSDCNCSIYRRYDVLWPYPMGPVEGTEMGVNARNFEAGTRDGVAVVKLDGASAQVPA